MPLSFESRYYLAENENIRFLRQPFDQKFVRYLIALIILAINPNADLVYVGRMYSNTVSVINGNSELVVINVPVGGGSSGLLWMVQQTQ